MTVQGICAALLATLLNGFGSTAYAGPSNEEFAVTVQNELAAMKVDEQRVERAKAICQYLPQSRIEADPSCVAMQKLFSAQLRKGTFKPSEPKGW